MTDRVSTALHFDLSFVPPERPCRLHVGKHRVELKPHSDETRAAARELNAALIHVPDENLTHHAAAVGLPTEVVQLLLVTTPSQTEGAQLDTLLLSTIHVPRAARVDHIDALVEAGDHKASQPHPKLARVGALVSMREAKPAIVDVHDWKTAEDAAASIIFHHQDLVNIGCKAASVVHTIIEYSNGFSDLVARILRQALEHQRDPGKQNWAFEAPYLDTNMKPTSESFYNWSDTTKEWMKGPLVDSIKSAKNEPSLRSTSTNAGIYTIQEGTTVAAAPQEPASPGAAEETTEAEEEAAYWTVTNLTPHHGLEQSGGVSFQNNHFSTSFTNNWVRWLSGYVEFLGPNGEPVTPEGWKSQVPGGLAQVYDSDTKKYVAIFSSVNTILAIPVGNTPTAMSFPWPRNASSVKLLLGGLGRTGGIEGADGHYYGSWDHQVCVPGAIMTGIFNFGIPTACMIAGASVSLSDLNDLAKKIFSIVLDIAQAIVAGPVSSAIQGGNTTTLMTAFADLIPRLLLDAADLTAWMAAHVAEGAAEEATPIFGWIALAVSVASDLALLLESTIEVASSPATFTLVASRSIDATWTLHPDPDAQDTWPREATHYQVDAVFRDGTTRSTTGTLTSPQTGPITVTFDGAAHNRLPAGGDVKFVASFYSDTGWLAGSAVTDFMNADIRGNLLTVPEMSIKQRKVPLTANTRYSHNKTLTWDDATKSRVWGDAAPTATVHDLDRDNVGHNLGAVTAITLAEEVSELGYLWQASGQGLPLSGTKTPYTGQMYTFQTIDDRTTPEDGVSFVPVGFNSKPLIAFELLGAKETGRNVWVDPTDGAYHVRPLALKPGSPFDLAPGRSWGRFNQQVDSAVVHPAGYAVGITTTTSKIQVLRLGSITTDADAPLAEIYSGYGTRPGLVHFPAAVAALPGAGFVVLEPADPNLKGAAARVQAFDFLGNPAPVFAGNSSTAALKAEPAGETLLDLAIETKGFMYVLKYVGDGTVVEDYRLDLYSPDGTWLSQSVGMAAGRLCVDLWRTAYTLDFGVLAKPDGSRTEPTVSIWLPSTP